MYSGRRRILVQGITGWRCGRWACCVTVRPLDLQGNCMIPTCMLLLTLPWSGAIGVLLLRLFESTGSSLGPSSVTGLNNGPEVIDSSGRGDQLSSSAVCGWAASACGGARDLRSVSELFQTGGFAHWS
eukprot:5171422-Amphidinium_carterae.1